MNSFNLIITLPVGAWVQKISSELMAKKYMVGAWFDSGKTMIKGTLADTIVLNVDNVKLSAMQFSTEIENLLNELEIAYFSVVVMSGKNTIIVPSKTPLNRLPINSTYDLSTLN
jgi:hypothetical protein